MGKTYGIKCQHRWEYNRELKYWVCLNCKQVDFGRTTPKLPGKVIGTLASLQGEPGW